MVKQESAHHELSLLLLPSEIQPIHRILQLRDNFFTSAVSPLHDNARVPANAFKRTEKIARRFDPNPRRVTLAKSTLYDSIG